MKKLTGPQKMKLHNGAHRRRGRRERESSRVMVEYLMAGEKVRAVKEAMPDCVKRLFDHPVADLMLTHMALNGQIEVIE